MQASAQLLIASLWAISVLIMLYIYIYNEPMNSDRQSNKNKLECNYYERTKNIYPRAD